MYKPEYDTTIKTTTVTKQHNTLHIEEIDWNYPFDDPQHTASMCCSEEAKRADTARRKEWLHMVEEALASKTKVLASTYGGVPRIYHRVLMVCMASCWPFWEPRPTLIVESSIGGIEWYDWRSLTDVKLAD